MKSSHSIRRPIKKWAFTLIELLVVIAIIAILAGFALPAFTRAQKKGRISNTVNNAKQITLALRMYGDDNGGAYPNFQTDGVTLFADSNTAFAMSLMPTYLSNKTVFLNTASAWCKPTTVDTTAAQAAQLQTKQNDWIYITNLNTATSDPRWPLIANAPMAGATTYATNTSTKGGVWAGTDAVVGLCDGSVQVFSGPAMGTAGANKFIKHPENATWDYLNGLSSTDWFAPAGSNVLTLYPN